MFLMHNYKYYLSASITSFVLSIIAFSFVDTIFGIIFNIIGVFALIETIIKIKNK
jgi:hypothetical protein